MAFPPTDPARNKFVVTILGRKRLVSFQQADNFFQNTEIQITLLCSFQVTLKALSNNNFALQDLDSQLFEQLLRIVVRLQVFACIRIPEGLFGHFVGDAHREWQSLGHFDLIKE